MAHSIGVLLICIVLHAIISCIFGIVTVIFIKATMELYPITLNRYDLQHVTYF